MREKFIESKCCFKREKRSREEISRQRSEREMKCGKEIQERETRSGKKSDSGRMEKKEKIGGKDFAREERQIKRRRKRRLPTRLRELTEKHGRG